MNVTQIILAICQIFHLKCIEFNFGWGELTALLQTPWIWGKEMEYEGKRRGKGNVGEMEEKRDAREK